MKKLSQQRARIRRVNVPVEVRQEYGEQNIANPDETAEVDIVSELDPKTVRVRYKGKEFPISKEHLTVAALENRIQTVDAKKILSELVAQKDWSGRKGVLEAYSIKQLKELENYLDDKDIQDPIIRTAVIAVLTKKTGETLFDEQPKSKKDDIPDLSSPYFQTEEGQMLLRYAKLFNKEYKRLKIDWWKKGKKGIKIPPAEEARQVRQILLKLADELSRRTGMPIDECMSKIVKLSKKLSEKRTAEMDKHTYEDIMNNVRHNVETVRNLLHKIEGGKNYVDELEYHTRELRKIFEHADVSGLADRNGDIVPPEE